MSPKPRSPLLSFFKAALPDKGQRGWHWLVSVLLALLLANTLFLLARRYGFGCSLEAYGACDVSVFYQGSVLLHSLLGLLVVVAAVGFLVLHLPTHLDAFRKRPRLPATGLALIATLLVLLGSGLYFLFNAKTAQMDWLYDTHIILAAVIVLAYFGHRALARPRQVRRVLTGGSAVVVALAVGLVMVEVGTAPQTQVQTLTDLESPAAVVTDQYVPPSKVDPAKPFFPSPVSLTSGEGATDRDLLLGITPEALDTIRREVEQQGFATTVPIGAEKCVRCHQDTVAQWASSAHRFSSFNNPFYVATIQYLRDTEVEPNEFIDQHLTEYGLDPSLTGRVKSRWCAGCHDPLLMLSGKMIGEIDKGSLEAQAGLVCLSCHAMADIPDHTGNGNYVWNDLFRDSYIFSRAGSGLPQWLHDTYLKANPERHKADMIKPFFQQAEFCATCHKVSLDRPVNDYRWLRGQNEYDNWHNSGVAHNAGRTFYLPPGVRQCQDCHMPLVDAPLGDLAATDGKVRSHDFAAANTALPFLRGDTAMIERTEQMLRGNKLRLFVGGMTGGHGEMVPLTDAREQSLPLEADRLELHVVVRNLGVGHTFPGGTNDSNEGWVQVTATRGETTLAAGAVGEDGAVVDNTRIYHLLAVDKNAQRITKRNAHEMITPVYGAVIPPGTADLSRYAIPLEQLGDLEEGAQVQVRLLWRKFNQPYMDFAWETNRAGFAGFDQKPQLPITEIAAVSLDLRREGGQLKVTARPPEGVESAPLLHDYAIGALRQGDYKLARQVTDRLLELEPDCVNCLRTLARIQLGEGQFDEARRTLTRAEAGASADPQNAWLWAQLLFQEGNYPAADSAVDRVLEAFKGDRMAHKLKARIAYLDGRFQDSLTAVDKALTIDPEDATALYYAMLAHRALGNREQEKEFEAAYRYHKADETAQQVTLAFRQMEDQANLAAQQIKVFQLQ